MKIGVVRERKKESGSALIVSLLIVMVIGVSLGSYLALVSSQNKSVMRSLAWNAAVPAMEAGVEEALLHLWHYGTTNSYFGANGWSLKADGWYQKSVSLGNDFGYVVRIQPVEPPNIMATGLAPAPLGSLALGTTTSSILTAARDVNNFVRRSVRVPTRKDRLFAKAMVAKGQIDLQGNSVQTDSFDSTDVRFSTGGRYDPLKRKDNGDIATNSGLVDSLNVGNAKIMGEVSTGYGGSMALGPEGAVGDALWVSSGRYGIQPGHSSSDMNIDFPSVNTPYTSGAIPPSGTVDGVDYDYVVSDGDWYVSSIRGKVLVTGNARLYVRDSIDLKGEDQVKIQPTGSLDLFMAGSKATIAGNGVLNETGSALGFRYWGLDSNTELKLAGDAAFTGVIYAPEAAFYLGGGGETTRSVPLADMCPTHGTRSTSRKRSRRRPLVARSSCLLRLLPTETSTVVASRWCTDSPS
jgi:hypothetical protein